MSVSFTHLSLLVGQLYAIRFTVRLLLQVSLRAALPWIPSSAPGSLLAPWGPTCQGAHPCTASGSSLHTCAVAASCLMCSSTCRRLAQRCKLDWPSSGATYCVWQCTSAWCCWQCNCLYAAAPFCWGPSPSDSYSCWQSCLRRVVWPAKP